MKKSFTILCLFLLSSYAVAQTIQTIQSIINKVSIDTLMNNLRELTGDKPVILNNVSTSLLSRNRYSAGNSYTPIYLMQKFSRLGLVSFQQNFMSDGQNVYAIQNGTTKSNQYVIICAHYDNMPSGGFAPGADDNGSGTAAVLEAARILSKYNFEYTIIYALWDLEEYGLYGSNYYASEASFRGDNIVAVINLDMIAWDSNNDYKAEVHTRNVSNSLELGLLVHDVNSKYSIGINLFTSNPGSTASDHASFWRFNYPAVLLIEIMSDFNLYYHKTTDDITKVNKTFYEKMTKLALGVTATSAVPIQNTSVAQTFPSEFQLYQHYPNPFNPETTISYKLQAPSKVSLKVFDLFSREVATLVNEYQQTGTYNSQFLASLEAGQLSSGIYFYTLRAGNFLQTRKMLLIK